MAAEGLLDYWNELQARQSDWAFRAYDRLVKTLSKDVQEKLQLKEQGAEPYIAIFGKTQVGKTTLLLDLMGIQPDFMSEVSEVMRGGRELGRSSTATAMEYCRSRGDSWGLTLHDKTRWFDSNEAVSHQLGQLRDAMESGGLALGSPCVVHIPTHFFAGLDAGAPSVRILDLPGDNPANDAEQKHVTQMAKTYLPFADLILLVGRGDDLSFLRPEVITLPGIEDWQAIPHRFRVVTTYSYSAQSVKDFIRDQPNVDATQVRRRLIQQIELFGALSEAAKQEDLYFPLEFGNSWMGVEKNEPGLHQRMAPLISCLRNELLDHIFKATSPMGRLRSTLNTHLSVKYVQKTKTAEIERSLVKLAEMQKTLKDELAQWEKTISRAQRKRSGTLKKLELISSAEVCESFSKALVQPLSKSGHYPPAEGSIKDDCATLKAMVSEYYRILKTARLDLKSACFTPLLASYWTHVSQYLLEPDIDVINDVLDDAFGSIRAKLADYTFATYLFSSNYRSDRDSVRNAGRNSEIELTHLWKSAWMIAKEKVDTELRTEQENETISLEILQAERERSVEQQAVLQREIKAKEAELVRIVSASQEDLERCDRFVHLLDEEYLDALTKRMDTAMQDDDRCESLLGLLSCVELRDQREQLMDLNKQGSRAER